MPEQRAAEFIKKRIDNLAQKYETKGEQLLYEQGILLGLLAVLSINDSKNFDIIINKLKSLE
jgi:deoxyribodipyrimidine photolyase